MFFYALLFAQETTHTPEGPSLFSALMPIILILILFYIMFIIPHQKEQKKTQEMLKSLKPGDKVLTAGGIIGIIDNISEKDDIIHIKVGDVRLNVLRPYIIKKFEKQQ